MLVAFPSTSILDSTAAGRSLLTAVDAAAQRSLLGLGTLATQSGNIADYLTIASAATTYQPLDSDLTAIAALTTTTYGRSLLTNADAPATRTTLGLGTGDSPTFASLTTTGIATVGDRLAFSTVAAQPRLRRLGNVLDVVSNDESAFSVFRAGELWLGSSLALVLDVSDVLAQRRGVNAQAFRVYNTFTDINNFERAKIAWESNILRIGTEKFGTGSARALEFQTDGATRLTISAGGVLTTQNLIQIGGSANAVVNASANASAAEVVFTTNQNYAPAGGSRTIFSSTNTFVPTSGTATYTGVGIAPTINQTGGANGITRGIHINPTLTAAADFRAIESSNGSVVLTDTYAAGSGSLAGSLLNLSQTWNTTGTPTAISLNVTDTASNGGNLLALRVGGANRFSVDKSGIVLASSTIVAAASLQATAGNIQVQSAAATIGWQPGGTWDLTLFRDAANILAQRNGVNSQTLRVYNTFTDASNYERAKIAWESNVLRIGTEKLGTGSARALELQTDGVTRFTINAAGNATFAGNINTSTGLMQLSNVIFNCGSSIASLYGNLFQPVSLRVFNITDGFGTNFEYGQFAWNSNVLQIGTVKGGTGAARALELQTDGQTRLTIATTGQVQTTWGFTVGTTLQVGSGGNILRTNSTRIEARNATDSAYQNIAGLSLMTTAPDVGSNATPANSNLELRFFNVAYLAGMMRGRGRASNVSFGDVILAANPDVSVVDGSNLSDDFVVKGNTGNVEVNRGRLNVAAATTSRASLNIPSGSDPTSPNDGDIWQAGNLLKTRLNGRTQTLSYQITSGTAAPTGGSDGDIYLQYI